MKIEKLEIRKFSSYEGEYGEGVFGIIQLTGEMGKIETKLSHKTVGEIFRLCREDVASIALRNAKEAPLACDDAADEVTLKLENQEIED